MDTEFLLTSDGAERADISREELLEGDPGGEVPLDGADEDAPFMDGRKTVADAAIRGRIDGWYDLDGSVLAGSHRGRSPTVEDSEVYGELRGGGSLQGSRMEGVVEGRTTAADSDITGNVYAPRVSLLGSVLRGGHVVAHGGLTLQGRSAVIADRMDIVEGGISTSGRGGIRDESTPPGSVVAVQDPGLGPSKSDRAGKALGRFSFRNLTRDGLDMGPMNIAIAGIAGIGDMLGLTYDRIELDEDLTLLTPEEMEGAVTYTGDWNGLAEYVEDAVPEGRFAFARVFDLNDRYDALDDLRRDVERLDGMYREIDDAYEDYRTHEGAFDLSPLEGDNAAIHERLQGFDAVKRGGGSLRAVRDPAEPAALVAFRGSGPLTYEGDWDELRETVERMPGERIAGINDALGVFDLDAVYEDATALAEDADRIADWYDEIEDAYEFFLGFEDVLGLELPEGNEARLEYLRAVREHARDAAMDRWDVEPGTAGALLESDNLEYFAGQTELGGIRGRLRSVIGRNPGGEFLDTFFGDDPDEYVTRPGFERTYAIHPEREELTEDLGETRDAAYESGLDLLRDIRRNAVKVDAGGEVDHDRLEELGKKIGEAARNGDEARKEELIEERERVKREARSAEDEIEHFFDRLQGDFSDLEDPGPDAVQYALRQAAQELLPADTPAQEKAEQYAEAITVRPDEITAEAVQVRLWDKDPETAPTQRESRCCAFIGGVNEHALVDYMRDPHTQIMEVRTGDKVGYATMFEARGAVRDYLVVDTLESSSHMFHPRNTEVVEATLQGIEEYAEEAGHDAVIYNADGRNSAPREFVETIEEEFPEEYDGGRTVVRKRGPSVYDETGFPVRGYRKTLDDGTLAAVEDALGAVADALPSR